MKNLLIADAGSSKTSWSFIDKETNDVIRFKTDGINPAHDSRDSIMANLKEVKDLIFHQSVDKILFFGAGCATPLLNHYIYNAFTSVFNIDNVIVDSDLKGAYIALFGNEDGIACILGTGSASALFSKGEIMAKTPSLGFILGDEGGGVSLGKHLLNAVFKNQLSDDLIEKFQKKYNLSLEELIEKVYKQPKPAPFIASFSPFLLENVNEKDIQLLIEKEFENFFKKNIMPYKALGNYKIGFIGSIALNYKEILLKTADKFGFQICKILKDPLPAIEKFYLDSIM